MTTMTKVRPTFVAAALALHALAIPAAHATTTIYSHTFAGGSATNDSLNTTTTTVGGGTWVSSDWRANGTTPTGTGTASNDDGAYLSFTPTVGLIYTLSMTATQPTGGDNTGWLGLGFTQGNTASNTSFASATINGAPWLLWRPSNAGSGGASQVVTRLGPAATTPTDEGAFTGTQTLTMVLNTQATLWTAEWFVGATSVRGPEPFASNPTINHVGFARENGQGSTITSFSLTSVPEPSSALLGGLGMLALLRRRRY
jgi:hypothetical protein